MRFLIVAVLSMLAVGCAHRRDVREPTERMLQGTAYTLQRGEMRVDTGIIGFGLSDLGASVGMTGGVTKRFQLGANLAHGALGLVNVAGKVNLLDHRVAAVAVRTNLFYGNAQTLWPLPESIRDQLGPTHLVVWPMVATASFPVARWVHLHLGIGYQAVFASGEFTGTSMYADGGFASRNLFFEPVVHFFVAERIAFILRARLSAYARAQSNVSGEVLVQPGLVAGVESTEWVRQSFERSSRGMFGINAKLGRTTYLTAGLIVGRILPGLDWSVSPTVSLYWRLGPAARRSDKVVPP